MEALTLAMGMGALEEAMGKTSCPVACMHQCLFLISNL